MEGAADGMGPFRLLRRKVARGEKNAAFAKTLRLDNSLRHWAESRRNSLR